MRAYVWVCGCLLILCVFCVVWVGGVCGVLCGRGVWVGGGVWVVITGSTSCVRILYPQKEQTRLNARAHALHPHPHAATLPTHTMFMNADPCALILTLARTQSH